GSHALVTVVKYSREDDTVPVLLAMQAGGADVFEVGVPFSNPIAAFKTLTLRVCPGVEYATVLGAITLRWGCSCSLTCAGYYIPILNCIPPRHADRVLCDAGASGFVMEDLQPEEVSGFRRKCTEAG
ncbi:hypothetical protein BKA82DRAFT_149688, partial [Pisolithus tinctorius]